MSGRMTKDFHWIGNTLMAKEYGEVIELCSVDWSGLDDYEPEHKHLIAAAPELLEALEEAMGWLSQVRSDPRINHNYILFRIRANDLIAKARGQS